MANWNGTIEIPAYQVKNLESFIHEPYTRTGDIFDQGQLDVTADLTVDWIIKHDLYEGVVVHLSLMEKEAIRFLVGAEATLSLASDLLTTFTLEHGGNSYTINVTEAS